MSNADDNHKFVKITGKLLKIKHVYSIFDFSANFQIIFNLIFFFTDFGLSTFCRVDLNATARNELFIPPEILLNHQVFHLKSF